MTKIEFTPYLASAYVEGFCEGESATPLEQIEAMAYLIKTGICWKLQGFYGRQAEVLISHGIVNEKGIINYEILDNFLNGE